ncbi:hypothetical protein F6X40_09740 [Paraburkholderia sp. UCT31]|uniref:hypothetical protein n=1 Tax=Paraburkholderia sp. UCT31 TaxID=2615209 RepID=UPI001654CDF7|nr:hypothetical protein [Paraburkholderia sp. UCT31]MBC8737089.1 hypothetical protein [Paraburkholderia sp. UCT31]
MKALRSKVFHHAVVVVALVLGIFSVATGMTLLQLVPSQESAVAHPDYPVALLLIALAVVALTLAAKLVLDPRCAPRNAS